ncbi:MAG: sigma-70 family RNA polymerase sigma factor [Anaerolineales bacterium]|nr:sigma-70 family RNA polymerase sigma factor [Anaerolineales bacterium]MCB9171482.1 sigma-70 family RNA polymerase sigma factor [Ardenticatenales bacterium]
MNNPVLLSEQSDRWLIEQSLAGNNGAWAALIGRYERLIYSIPLRYGMSESQAADIFQDVCLILLERLEQLRDHERMASWLGTTTRRECWRHTNRRDRAGPDDPDAFFEQQPSALEHPEVIVEAWERYTALHQALAKLEARCRTLLKRLYFGYPPPTYVELGEELEMPVGSIGPTRARCLEKLRHEMHGENYRVTS